MNLTKKLVLEGSAQVVITISYKKCDKKATIIFLFLPYQNPSAEFLI